MYDAYGLSPRTMRVPSAGVREKGVLSSVFVCVWSV